MGRASPCHGAMPGLLFVSGAPNVPRGRARGLTGRQRLAAMTRAYETLRRDGQLPATYEVIHAICEDYRAGATFDFTDAGTDKQKAFGEVASTSTPSARSASCPA